MFLGLQVNGFELLFGVDGQGAFAVMQHEHKFVSNEVCFLAATL